ncbi:MAG: MgtC/SapB family protein [Candidatus Margulisbacteria bacterium]|jgi:putative Mg2+ transporter-C (MgtC) family protein|nr:MgtC/SapB family protein [Candidatus Margulisiibacteriota bacterium]
MQESLLYPFLQNILLALFCGGVIGLERSFRNKAAGFRTMMFICMGTAIFVDIALVLSRRAVNYNPGIDRIVGSIVTGIGFLGAGSIFRSSEKNAVEGLTTAATIWYVAGLGLLIGFRLYVLAVPATALALLILVFFGRLERYILRLINEVPLKFKKK